MQLTEVVTTLLNIQANFLKVAHSLGEPICHRHLNQELPLYVSPVPKQQLSLGNRFSGHKFDWVS